MRLRFFSVPAAGGEEAEQEVNRFLAAHRILAIDRELVTGTGGAYWALCVTYQPASGQKLPLKRGKIDYKEVLPPAQFAVFARLRALRKEIADREGVPAYALFTNEQLAAMVRREVRTREALGAIEGVGPARLEKYGRAFLAALAHVADPKELGSA